MGALSRTPFPLTSRNGHRSGKARIPCPETKRSTQWIQLNGYESREIDEEISTNFALQLTLLKTLILWSLSSSEIVKGLINQSYKQNRHEDDLNQPRSIQPWGNDGDKRRYFLIEGQDDTAFRVYRESNPAGTQRTWWSVAGSMEELSLLAEKLETKDGGPKAKKFAQRIIAAMPRFEAGEDVRAHGRWQMTIDGLLTCHRNESDASIGKHKRSASSALIRASLCTRAGRVESV